MTYVDFLPYWFQLFVFFVVVLTSSEMLLNTLRYFQISVKSNMNDWSRKELCVFVEVWRENKEDKNYEQMGST